MVKETKVVAQKQEKDSPELVSIPSRGSGKGDLSKIWRKRKWKVLIPSRGSGKGDSTIGGDHYAKAKRFNPLSGKW